jgi:hypothetical protein
MTVNTLTGKRYKKRSGTSLARINHDTQDFGIQVPNARTTSDCSYLTSRE